MEDKILYYEWGGLGDALQFSTLPRRFSELGYKFYIASSSHYRNSEIKQLVWDMNPYVVGESDKEPNCGGVASTAIDLQKTDSFLANWEISHGLPAPYSKYPEVYYQPKINNELSGKTFIDITCTSGQQFYDANAIREYLKDNVDTHNSILACFHDGIGIPMLLVDNYEFLVIQDIFHYCDVIASCRKFICLHSGGMALASALKKYQPIDCDCLVSKHPIYTVAMLNHHHFYDNINYITI